MQSISFHDRRKEVEIVEETTGWKTLLEDPFFKHIYISTGSADDHTHVNRLLKVIHSLLFSQNISFSTENSGFTLPDRDIDKETLGVNTTFLQNSLEEALLHPQAIEAQPAKFPYLDIYLEDGSFQRYVSNLLDFIKAKAEKALPDLGDNLSSREEREKITRQENDFDLNEIVVKAENAQKAAQAAQSAAERLQNEARKAQEAAESVIPNMLTTLGIFIAIVIAVVACYLSLIMTQHMGGDAQPLSLVMILVMGHILSNIIFLLLYLISKMSNHPAACHCPAGEQMSCTQCRPELRQHCNWGNKLLLRYPYMVLLNGLFFLGYTAFGLWRLFQPYWSGTVLPLIHSNWLTALFWAVVLLGVLVFACVQYLRSPVKRAAKHAENQQKEAKKDLQRTTIRHLERELQQLNAWQQTQQRQSEEQMRLLAQLRGELDALREQQQTPVGAQPPSQ